MARSSRDERSGGRAGDGGGTPPPAGAEKDGASRDPAGRRTRLPGSGSEPLDRIDGISVAIIGLGASGRAAARLALERGAEVHVTEIDEDPETAAEAAELRRLGARVELGRHRVERLARADAVVVSPGIPPDAPVLRDLRERGVGWISELEFAFRFLQGPLIAVTGTNGKSTTAVLTTHLLEAAGNDVGLGGNIGAGLGPAASELARRDPAPDWFVLEASSFQLADVEHFSPEIGMITNLAPDHLDRYPDREAYYADKARIFDNATEESRWVLNGDQPRVRELPGRAPGLRRYFGLEPESDADAALRDGALTLRTDGRRAVLLEREALPLLGSHNVANALAAALAAHLAGAPTEALSRGLATAPSLPHRLEPVVERDGVLWVDDSKATNVSAAVSAVGSLERPVVWLLGGKDKGEDFARLLDVLDDEVRAVVVYGAAGERIAGALEGRVAMDRVEGSFEDVVRAARRRARPGDAVLLSPACSSFDMFESYEARGRRFAALAREEA